MRDDVRPGALRALEPDLLAAYVATEVVDAAGSSWSGAGAVGIAADTWVVTAENPFSEKQDAAVNAAAMAELEADIRAAGLEPVALVGRAPDHSWSEDCFGVRGADGETVRAWGRARGQHAVFLLTADAHHVVSCWTGERLATRPRVLRGS
jgi:hypothetical protein